MQIAVNKKTILVMFAFTAGFIQHEVSYALNESSQTFTLDGRLYKTGTTNPIEDSNLNLRISILSPDGNCVLYEETQSVNTTGTKGYFNVNVGSVVGSAKRSVNDPGRSMTQVFQNSEAIAANSVLGRNCSGNLFTPASGDVRYIRISVTPSLTLVTDILVPDIVIDSVPQALVAQSLQGIEKANILQANMSGSTALTQSNLEALFTSTAYNNLQTILNGQFLRSDSSGASLPVYTSTPPGVAVGDIWFDSNSQGIKYQSSTGVQTLGTSSSGVSSITASSAISINGSVAGVVSNGAATIDLTDTGVGVGTYAKVTVDSKGRVSAGTSLSESDIPNLSSAGKVSGAAITSGTISGTAAINTSGNLVTTGTVSGLNVHATNVRIFNGSNYAQLTASTMSGNINFTLPETTGSVGQVLSTDGNGLLSWISAGLPSLLSGKIWVGNGSNSATAVDLSGDATISNSGILTLNTVPVSKGGTGTTSIAANRIISTNGTGSAYQAFSCALNQVISFDGSGFATCANVSALSGGITNGGNSTGAAISIGTNDNFALSFKANNLVAMTISNNGYVGIGTTYPTTAFEVSGVMTLTGMASTPANAATNSGSIYFDTSTNKFKVSQNGSAYTDLVSSGGSGSVTSVSSANSDISVATGTSTPVLTLNSGTGASQILKLDESSRIPAVNGSLVTNLSAANIATGTLPIARGGTNSSGALSNNRLMFSSGGAIVEMGAMINGQIVVGSTGQAPQVVAMSGDATISNTGSVTVTKINGVAPASANTASAVVVRDVSGNFSAGTISVGSVVTGTLQVTGRTPGAGKVLISDANGNASWGSGSGNMNSAISLVVTLGNSCSNVGQMAVTSSGDLVVCDDSPSTLSSGAACSGVGAGAVTFNTNGEMYVCAN